MSERNQYLYTTLGHAQVRTSCDDVRSQREREKGRNPRFEIALEYGADALDLGKFVTDAVPSD